MVTVVGKDTTRVKRVTCDSCASILEYFETELKTARYTVMGDDSGYKYVSCPTCGGDARIPGTSW